jgi:hypothetical protein
MVSVIDLMQYMQYRVDCCFPGILQSEILACCLRKQRETPLAQKQAGVNQAGLSD